MHYRWPNAVVGLFFVALGLLVLMRGQKLSKFFYSGRLAMFGQRAAGKGQPRLARWWQIILAVIFFAFGALAIVGGFQVQR